jgi:undecaprenyl-diphosphatase
MVCSSFISILHRLDQDATLFINSFSTPATEQFWMLMSDKTIWIPAYILSAFFLFRRLGWKKAVVVLCSVGLAFGLCDQFSTIVKNSVDRLRPSYSARMLLGGLNVLEGRGGFFGFFSAHAANAFALAMCLIIGFRNDRTHSYNGFYKFALIWASLVAVSRIFVGKHYLGDVIVGAAVGLLIGYFIGMLARYIIQTRIDKVPFSGLTMIFDANVPALTSVKTFPF